MTFSISLPQFQVFIIQVPRSKAKEKETTSLLLTKLTINIQMSMLTLDLISITHLLLLVYLLLNSKLGILEISEMALMDIILWGKVLVVLIIVMEAVVVVVVEVIAGVKVERKKWIDPRGVSLLRSITGIPSIRTTDKLLLRTCWLEWWELLFDEGSFSTSWPSEPLPCFEFSPSLQLLLCLFLLYDSHLKDWLSISKLPSPSNSSTSSTLKSFLPFPILQDSFFPLLFLF